MRKKKSINLQKFVHAPGTESRPHSVRHSAAGVDVRNQLRLALARVRALPQHDNTRLDLTVRHPHRLLHHLASLQRSFDSEDFFSTRTLLLRGVGGLSLQRAGDILGDGEAIGHGDAPQSR